jgi:hypothetical protein
MLQNHCSRNYVLQSLTSPSPKSLLKNLVARQKETRRGEYLQNQAEQQLRKIAHAERPQHVPQNCGLTENSTFQHLTQQTHPTVTPDVEDYEQEEEGGRFKIYGHTVQIEVMK